ncbi:MAG TPA: hypothetical protein PKM73_19045 [Verrucomicrobiota bacterium]|nr:hypothetical protein [Verrucomicrobiota bacterium]HNU52819.1 hypothetical protein [Verrucomicrobiota bacterium]
MNALLPPWIFRPAPRHPRWPAALLLVLLTAGTGLTPAQAHEPPPVRQVWHYRLLDDSVLVDDCHCGRPAIPYLLRGEFDLALVGENPIETQYRIFNLDLRTDSDPVHWVRGEGEVRVGGEVALRQQWTLDTTATGERKARFTNPEGQLTRLWPMIAVDLLEQDGPILSFYHLEIRAAPFHELWFSTMAGMTSGVSEPPFARYSGGDVLTSDGRLVRDSGSLLAAVGLEPGGALAPGLDALDIVPGGELWFSLDAKASSKTLGTISPGDLLSDQGKIVRRGSELVRGLGFMPPAPDLGLDALQVLEGGEILFSTTEGAFSESLGLIRHGDLLSDRGRIHATQEQLLARFHPEEPGTDYGLDAVHVWPSGEIWFSVAEGFRDKELGYVLDGDLISDQGYVISRNLNLVGRFSPLEDLADFGLDALFVVTDVTGPPEGALLTLARGAGGELDLHWAGKGRVSRVESIDPSWSGSAPLSPILPGSSWVVPAESAAGPAAFLRLRQW